MDVMNNVDAFIRDLEDGNVDNEEADDDDDEDVDVDDMTDWMDDSPPYTSCSGKLGRSCWGSSFRKARIADERRLLFVFFIFTIIVVVVVVVVVPMMVYGQRCLFGLGKSVVARGGTRKR